MLDVRFSKRNVPETDGLPARMDRLIACAFEPDAVTTCRASKGSYRRVRKAQALGRTSRDRSNVKRVPISSLNTFAVPATDGWALRALYE